MNYSRIGGFKADGDSVRFHPELEMYHLYSGVNKCGRELPEEHVGKLDSKEK